MSKAADHTEKVLRELHILFSKAPAFERSGTNVVVDKTVVIDKLRELRQCMYEMMNEYELTQQSKEKAGRELQRENDERVYEATKRAQDIYAASIMYSERSLSELQDAVRLMQDNMEQMNADIDRRMRNELQQIKSNQLELKSRLEGLFDTEMYLKLIEDANWRREKEKQKATFEPSRSGGYTHVKADIRVNEDLVDALGGGEVAPLAEKNYADIIPEIRVNEEYLQKAAAADADGRKGAEQKADEIDIDAIGADLIAETMSSEAIADEHREEDAADGAVTQDISEEELAQISANLDAEYFGWKKEAEEELKDELEEKKNAGRKKKRRRQHDI